MGKIRPKQNITMIFGNIFEEAITAAAQHLLLKSHEPRQKAPNLYQRFEKPDSCFHAEHKDWLVVHPDGVFWDAKELIQVKRHDPRLIREYGAPGSRGEADNDIVPLEELIQCQIELSCWGSNRGEERLKWRICWLACDFGGADMRLYRIVKNPALIKTLLEVGRRLWHTHMQPENPVKPDDVAWKEWMDGPHAYCTVTSIAPRIRFAATDLLAAPPQEIGGE